MLKIRLSRGGRHKLPFYRIVLTEHTKPVKSGYKEVLGRYDPLKHTVKIDVEKIKERIGKGAQPSNRVAKIIYKETKDEFFKAYIVESVRTRKKKNAPDEPEEAVTDNAPAPQASKEKQEESKQEPEQAKEQQEETQEEASEESKEEQTKA